MAASNTVSDIHRPLVEANRFSYAYPGSPDWVLRDIGLRIYAGQCHLLQGPTGCGKTTLLLAIRGLLPPGRQTGSLRWVPPADDHTRCPGLLLQNPGTQLLCSSLGADVAFGLENHGLAPAAMPEKVRAALSQVGLRQPIDRSVDALSMGQQYRACLAGVLVMQPHLIMMDEPMAQLDPRGQDRLLSIIHDLKRSGRALLICDHRPEALLPIADRTWQMDPRGRIHETTGKRPRPVSSECPVSETVFNGHQPVEPSDTTLVNLNGLTFAPPKGELDLASISFKISRGERVVILGANGTGKTTLTACLSGLRPFSSGTIEVFGQRPRLKNLRGRMTVLFQDPRRQIFETTVFDEVAFYARRSGRNAAEVKRMVDHLLEKLQLSDLSAASPHKLSYGQKHLVGLAAALSARPELVVLDDPFAGLDAHRTRLVMELLALAARDWRTTVIWTTHAPLGLPGWADRVIRLPSPHHGISMQKDGATGAASPLAKTAVDRRLDLKTGFMLGLCLLLSMGAFAVRSPALLAVLSSLNLLLIVLFCPRPLSVLRESLVFFLWQAIMVILLYMIRFGIQQGAGPGFLVSWQLFLALWPGMIFMASNAQSRIVAALSRVMPHRTAFVAATCLRFLPMLLSEVQQIRAIQTLRGARLLLGDLKYPRYWPDWIHCLLIPALIKTLSLASDISTAATARDFGIQPKRTAWPGE